MKEIKNIEDSAYAKRYSIPFINTHKDKNNGKEDIIVFWYAMTAKHKFSKHNAIMVIPKNEFPNGIPLNILMERIESFRFPYLRELRSGKYIWSKPLLYSGNVIE